MLLIVSPSTNTRSGPKTSTETTALVISPWNSSYVTHNEFSATIKDLMAEFKEYIKNIITNQYAKVDDKIEKQLHPLSLQVKNISSNLSSFTKKYNYCLERIRKNFKISNMFDIVTTETESYLKMKLDLYKSETYIGIYMKLSIIN